MSFWSRLFTKKPETPGAVPPALPAEVVVVPDVLSALVAHTDGESPALSVSSAGLQVLGQAEITLSVALHPDEDPQAVLAMLVDFLRTVHRFAAEGRLVTAGGVTQFGPKGFLSEEIGGIVYTEHEGGLAGVLVRRDELSIIEIGGVYRLLSRLGETHSHFPFPPTSERRRASESTGAAESTSTLAQVPHVLVAGLSASLEGDRVHIIAAPDVQASMRRHLAQIPPGSALAFLTVPHRSATGWFTWRPGQTAPSAITGPQRDDSRLAGHALLIAPGQEQDHIRLIEDGFGLILCEETWTGLRTALTEGRPFTLHPEAGYRLQLTWSSATHLPQNGPAIEGQQVVLLSSDAQLQAAIAIDALSAYIRTLFDAATPLVQPGDRLSIRVDLCAPAQATLQTDPDLPAAQQAVLERIEVPAVQAPIAFQLLLAPPSSGVSA